MQTGDLVDDFRLPDQYGTERSLSELVAHGPVVLFFYPAAMTKGCTKESCYFRDLAAEFATIGAQRVGISMDDVATQKKFSDENGFDYPLLSDVDGSVAKQFGVKRRLDLLKVQRATFVIGPDRRILGTFRSETNMNAHAEEALALLSHQ